MKHLHTSIEVETFFSLIFSYFCFFVPAFSPCHGRLQPHGVTTKSYIQQGWSDIILGDRIVHLPLKKYIRTYPRDSKSSLRLCSRKKNTQVKQSGNINFITGIDQVNILNTKGVRNWNVVIIFTNAKVSVHASISCSSSQIFILSAIYKNLKYKLMTICVKFDFQHRTSESAPLNHPI
jgi:hypothetical protein